MDHYLEKFESFTSRQKILKAPTISFYWNSIFPSGQGKAASHSRTDVLSLPNVTEK